MALNFPDPAGQTPVNTFSPTSTPNASTNGVTYVWDTEKWVAADAATFLPIGGGTLTGDLAVPSLNGGPLAGYRNAIINGDFRIWQRGTSIDVVSGGSNYTADRWRVANPGAIQAVSRQNSTLPGFAYEASFNTALGSIYQGVELDRLGSAEPFTPGSTWTFSCWAGYQDISAADFVVRFGGAAVGGGVDITPVFNGPFGAAVETAPNSWGKYVVTFSIPNPLAFAANPRFLEVILPGGAALGGLIRYTGCQLEPGPVATPFEHRPIGTELALCQRYYLVGENRVQNSSFDTGYVSNWLAFPVLMRAAPDLTSTVTLKVPPNVDDPTVYVTDFGVIFSSKNVTGSDIPNHSLAVDFTADAEL